MATPPSSDTLGGTGAGAAPGPGRLPRALGWALVALGALLTLTVVPAPFTVDEPNHLVSVLALRHGRLTVPGTEGLPPSRALAYFDPAVATRRVTVTPVSSTVPPWYAPLALPFFPLGWRGLVLLNTLAFLATTALVFAYARAHATGRQAGWLAAAAFALGGATLEYAQGMWPHMLSVALVAGTLYLASRVRQGGALALAGAAGALAGLAAGVRYQNVVVVAAAGAGLLLWGPRRLRATGCFALGLLLPLAGAAAMNRARLGFWHPLSKGPDYLPALPAGAIGAGGSLLAEAPRMFWARVVDHAAAPRLVGTVHDLYMRPDPVTGAWLVGDAMKKAWLQSAPWILLALVVLALAWLARRGLPGGTRREARALSLAVAGVLLVFAGAGAGRTDGLAFNQRYFLELVPLVAVAFAWALERARLGWGPVLAGALAAGLAVAGLLAWAPLAIRLRGETWAPLALGVLLVAAWTWAGRPARAAPLGLLVGACLGWALVLHVGEDLRASRARRGANLVRAEALARAVPDRSALFAWTGTKDAAGRLHLDRDVVVLDLAVDEGADAERLAEALRARGRRLFVSAHRLPPRLAEMFPGVRRVRVASPAPVVVLELEPPS